MDKSESGVKNALLWNEHEISFGLQRGRRHGLPSGDLLAQSSRSSPTSTSKGRIDPNQ
jgi:hypothetical protein